MRTWTDKQEAAEAATEGECVSAIFVGRTYDGKVEPKPGTNWLYFLTPKDADPDVMRELAFEARHGKPMDSYQRSLLKYAAEKLGV